MSSARIAFISGANKGLGFETSRQLSQLGIKVLMGSRNETRGRAAAESLKSKGLDAEFMPLDITSSEHIQAVKKSIEENFGKLDILVNNAGMAHQEEPLAQNSVETISPKALREVFDVNVFGLVHLTQTLLPLIRKSDAGRIVNVASILGSLTIHSDVNSDFYEVKPFAYDASKSVVNQFTIHLAAALRETAIKVNSAHPGWVKTGMGGDQAPMEIADGAKTAVRLATLGTGGPTGKFIHLDEELPW